MPEPTPFVEFVRETFSPLGEITVRFMMGGWCVYCDGAVCALIADNELYLKAGPGDKERFLARGLRPFQPFADRPMVMQYYQAPPELFEDPDALQVWGGAAVAAGRATKRTRQPRQSVRRKRS